MSEGKIQNIISVISLGIAIFMLLFGEGLMIPHINTWRKNKEDNEMLRQASIHFINGDFEGAYKILNDEALIKNSVAQNNIGFLYENGLGVKESYELAHAQYSRAIKLGYIAAYANLIHLNLESSMYKTRGDFLRDVKIGAEMGNDSCRLFLANLLEPSLSDDKLKSKKDDLANQYIQSPEEYQIKLLKTTENIAQLEEQPYVDYDLTLQGELMWIEPTKIKREQVGTYVKMIINENGEKEDVEEGVYADVKYGILYIVKFEKQYLFNHRFITIE